MIGKRWNGFARGCPVAGQKENKSSARRSPSIPDWKSEASRRGRYNLDPAVAFWATPPIHGCLRERVVHPAALTYRLPESVSYEEGAFVEPLAIGVHAAEAASIKPGDVAVVLGCGTIGVVTALAALAGGCSTVIITDVMAEKLSVVDCYRNIITVDTSVVNVGSVVSEVAGPRGADIVFDASGNRCAITDGIGVLGLAGRLVLIGMPSEPVPIDVVTLQMKEITVKTIFRYANDFEKAIRMIVSKTVDVFPLISRRFPFAQSIEAFELAKKQEPDVVKILINTD